MDLVDRAIEFIADAKQVAPDKPFFMYFCTGRDARAAPRAARSGPTSTRGSSTTAGTPTASRSFERQLRDGHLPPGTRALGARSRRRRTGTRCRADERRLYARMMEVFAGFLEHTDHQIGRLIDFLERSGRARQHARSWWSATTAPAPRAGRTARSTRTCSSTTCPERSRTTSRRSTSSAGPSTSTTTRGAGRGPATRRSGAGSARPTAAASPTRSSCTGRAGIAARGEIRTQYAHVIDMVPTVLEALGHRRRPTQIRGVTQSPIAGRLVRAHVRRREGARRGTTRSTSRCSGTARSITTAGARCVRSRDRRSPRPAWASASCVITEDKLRELDAKGWELYHVAEDFSETQERRRRSTATS